MQNRGHHEEHHHGGHHGRAGRHSAPEHAHSHADEDMLSVEDAYSRILECFSTLDAEEMPLVQSLGRVLAQDVYSPLDLPPLANSAMDGYALLAGDIDRAGKDSPVVLSVIGLVAAGQVSTQQVTPGAAIRIMTGAPIPAGADTVVPFEETDEVKRREAGQTLDSIAILAPLPRGSNVPPCRGRRAGGGVGPGIRLRSAGVGSGSNGLAGDGPSQGSPQPDRVDFGHRRRIAVGGPVAGTGQNLRQ